MDEETGVVTEGQQVEELIKNVNGMLDLCDAIHVPYALAMIDNVIQKRSTLTKEQLEGFHTFVESQRVVELEDITSERNQNSYYSFRDKAHVKGYTLLAFQLAKRLIYEPSVSPQVYKDSMGSAITMGKNLRLRFYLQRLHEPSPSGSNPPAVT